MANAKLQQAKQAVAQKVAAVKREKERASEELALAKRSLDAASLAAAAYRTQLEAIRKVGGVSVIEVQQITATLQNYEVTKLEHERAMVTAKAQLSNAEAEYETLVGKSAGVGNASQRGWYTWTKDSLRVDFSLPIASAEHIEV